MDVTSTIAAIRARCPSFAGQVYGAARFIAQDWKNPNPQQMPAAYVYCVKEDPQDVQVTENSYYQEIAATVRVAVAVPNGADERGQHAAQEQERLKFELFKALLGWSPEGDPQAIYTYGGCEVLDMSGAVLLMVYDFEGSYAIGVTDTRIPEQLEEDCGNFDTLDLKVDAIREPPGAPRGIQPGDDGHIDQSQPEDAHVTVTGLYGMDS